MFSLNKPFQFPPFDKPMAYNGWRYEKLPIAGNFLSSYTKVGAGYNP